MTETIATLQSRLPEGMRLQPGDLAVVRPHGQKITDAVITGAKHRDTPDGFVYTYRRTSNGAEGVILPRLTGRRSA